MLKVTVPETVDPALTLAGKLRLVERSASAAPVIVALALLLLGMGSVVVAELVVLTVEVAVAG